MKPRRLVLPLTKSDWEIWRAVRLGWIASNQNADSRQLLSLSFETDRRDAELMYSIELCREYERQHPGAFWRWQSRAWVHSMVDASLACGPIAFLGSDITYCA